MGQFMLNGKLHYGHIKGAHKSVKWDVTNNRWALKAVDYNRFKNTILT